MNIQSNKKKIIFPKIPNSQKNFTHRKSACTTFYHGTLIARQYLWYLDESQALLSLINYMEIFFLFLFICF